MTPANTPPRLEVLHRARGRLRVAVTPAYAAALDAVCGAALGVRGVDGAVPGASRANVVVTFAPDAVDEEGILTRMALALSAHLEYRSVQLIRGRRTPQLDGLARQAGGVAAAASLAASLAPGGLVAGGAGWLSAGLTLASVGRDLLESIGAGEPRPEGLSLLHLLSRLGTPSRGYGALFTWVLYHGPTLAEQARGAQPDAIELQPIVHREGVDGDDEGTHLEVVTRTLDMKAARDGGVLTPATLASAMIGWFAFAIGEGWLGD